MLAKSFIFRCPIVIYPSGKISLVNIEDFLWISRKISLMNIEGNILDEYWGKYPWWIFELSLLCLYRCCASLSFVPEAWRDWSADKLHILLRNTQNAYCIIILWYQPLILHNNTKYHLYCIIILGYQTFRLHYNTKHLDCNIIPNTILHYNTKHLYCIIIPNT